MAVASVQPVSVAVHALLDVTAFNALSTYDGPALKQDDIYPRSYYTVRGEDEDRGFGTGTLPRVEIWVHGVTNKRSYAECHAIVSKAKELLGDVSFASVTGFTQAGQIFFERIVDVSPYEINGKPIRESVAQFYTWVEA